MSYRWSRCLHLRTRRRQRRRHNRQKRRDLARLAFARRLAEADETVVVVRRKNPSTDPRRMLVARAVALAACKTVAAVAHIPRKFVAADTKAGQTSMATLLLLLLGRTEAQVGNTGDDARNVTAHLLLLRIRRRRTELLLLRLTLLLLSEGPSFQRCGGGCGVAAAAAVENHYYTHGGFTPTCCCCCCCCEEDEDRFI